MLEIKIIPTELTYKVRQPVLRPGKPIESCFFDGDDLHSTVHFGLFIDSDLLGVVSIFKNSSPFFSYNNQYQIRGMAVLDTQQGKGLGGLLIKKVEEYLSQTNTEIIWFNARESAVNFYKKMEYSVTGEPFEIPNIGKHIIMYKKLL